MLSLQETGEEREEGRGGEGRGEGGEGRGRIGEGEGEGEEGGGWREIQILVRPREIERKKDF